jgi:hypothetical protein
MLVFYGRCRRTWLYHDRILVHNLLQRTDEPAWHNTACFSKKEHELVIRIKHCTTDQMYFPIVSPRVKMALEVV